ncbi:conserved membrane protein of unknown function [Tenacibaculum sp. 190130A14a]|uniref:Uncharacterized protein n=1 Tax=Tenacibaculum polynesiense TaxID=3137857 RepID=A0ABM9P9W0_9FLAO
MELTKEQIKRIDAFLEGIGVEYIDIRLEMVDHIASEIEEKVDDVDAFFDNQRFQTPFIKYMLSQKLRLFKNYKKQVKRSFWFNIIKIIIDVFKEGIAPLNALFISLFMVMIFFVGKLNLAFVTNAAFVAFFVSYCYMTFLFHKLRKKFGNIRLLQAYAVILTCTYLISLYIPTLIFPFFDGQDYTIFNLYKLAAMLSVNFLVYKSYMSRKNTIETYCRTFI